MSHRNNLSFQKPRPKFLESLYKQVGYQEPNPDRDLDLKRRQHFDDAEQEASSRERGDREDEAPTIVVLDEKKHVAQEEYEEIVKAGGKVLDADEVRLAKRKMKEEVSEKFGASARTANTKTIESASSNNIHSGPKEEKNGGAVLEAERGVEAAFTGRPVFRAKNKKPNETPKQPTKKAKIERRTLSFDDE